MALLASLYLSQGLPFGFFTQALPVLMRHEGYSLKVIGLTTLLALPWALKFLWAPWVDRYSIARFGHRRSWILPLQAMMVCALIGVAWLSPATGLGVVLCAVLLVNMVSATQDIATDGLAVDILSHSERGLANGVQVAGYRLGMIVGGGVLLIFHERIGWMGTFLGMAAVIALASIPVLLHREKPSRPACCEVNATIRGFFQRPGIARIVLLIVVYKSGDAFATGMLRPFLADIGLTLAEVGWLLGTMGFVAGLVGALIGGALVGMIGRRRSLVVFGVLQVVTVAGYALVAQYGCSRVVLGTIFGAEHFAGGMATAALFTAMMDWCRPGANATDYTIQASLVVIATGVAATLSGFSAEALGFAGHFSLAALLAGIAVGLAALL
ncbi:MAG: MFS transporter, partial [Proteobacteria bacterium]|nr:MFS transporter [Pseudomonadota bacterium]